MTKKCVCGVDFKTDNRNAKFCGRECFYKNRGKLKVRKVQIERVCECGKTFLIDKAYLDRTKGEVGVYCSLKCKGVYCKKGLFENGHKSFTQVKEYSETPTYQELHHWIRVRLVKVKKCSFCGDEHCRTEWANKSQEYKKDLADWVELCVRCHRNYDKGNTLKPAIKIFGSYKKAHNGKYTKHI